MSRTSPPSAGGSSDSGTERSSATSRSPRDQGAKSDGSGIHGTEDRDQKAGSPMIGIPSTFKISLRALRVNKMRSALTMLGIIIGVGAVITMLAVGAGARKKIDEQIASMGSNLLIILPGATTSGGVRMGAGTQPTLSMGDAEAILKECPAVAYAAP